MEVMKMSALFHQDYNPEPWIDMLKPFAVIYDRSNENGAYIGSKKVKGTFDTEDEAKKYAQSLNKAPSNQGKYSLIIKYSVIPISAYVHERELERREQMVIAENILDNLTK